MVKKVLNDVSVSGYKRPWREKKLDNLTYAEYLEILNFKKAYNVRDCGETLEFVKTKDGRLKLYRTWFCHSRLCPLCAWRYSIKNTYEVSKILDTAKANNEEIEAAKSEFESLISIFGSSEEMPELQIIRNFIDVADNVLTKGHNKVDIHVKLKDGNTIDDVFFIGFEPRLYDVSLSSK